MSQLEVIRPANAEVLDTTQWANWLVKRNLITKDAVNAGLLIVNIQRGMNYIRNMIEMQTGTTWKLPKLVVAFPNPDLVGGLAAYVTGYDLVVVNSEKLQGFAANKTSSILECFRSSERPDAGKLSFVGTSADQAFLVGVDEADHANYMSEHKQTVYGDPRLWTLAEYDAQPIEMRGLEKRIEAANMFNMPQVTKDILSARLEAARLFAQKL